MTDLQTRTDEMALVLAAEECPLGQFSEMHTFSDHDLKIVRKLTAHGPVLLQGGRGSGKSALMIGASLAMAPATVDAPVVGLYISLRYVPLLQATGAEYERLFCEWVSGRIVSVVKGRAEFPITCHVGDLKDELTTLARTLDKRVVLLFDDAAHIGRETSLGRFFDIFRTLSSDVISCKAAIYPGVTEFGTRFDVYNDATLVDVVRSPEQPGFAELFLNIMKLRYPVLREDRMTGLNLQRLAHFIGAAVLGNVRGFIFACNYLLARADANQSIGYNVVGDTLLRLATDYYWPLLEEVKPKLGRYIPAVDVAQEVATILFDASAEAGAQSVAVHRTLVARYAKPFEILEYAGFISRREASRAMKSGGRGPRYAVNLCNLLDRVHGTRLTAKLFDEWLSRSGLVVELHERGTHFSQLAPPMPNDTSQLDVLALGIERLRKSPAYPYGLTDGKIEALKAHGILTVRDLALQSDDHLLAIDGIGTATLDRIRSVVGQAIWM